MSVILLILKIIGIILLVLLCLLILILACVLLIPVRYRIEGNISDTTSIRVGVSWLLHLISYSYVQEGEEISSGIRICGIRLRKREEKPEEDSGEEPDGTSVITLNLEKKRDAEDTFSENEFSEDEFSEENFYENDSSKKESMEDDISERKITETEASNSKKQGVVSQIRIFFAQIKNAVVRFWQALLYAKGIITDESNKIVLGSVWSELWYLLRHFRFRHICADVCFSLADPAVTGQVLGIICMMPFLYGQKVNIVPDFESEKRYMQGELAAWGKVRGVHVLVSMVRLLKQKEVRNLLKQFMNK